MKNLGEFSSKQRIFEILQHEWKLNLLKLFPQTRITDLFRKSKPRQNFLHIWNSNNQYHASQSQCASTELLLLSVSVGAFLKMWLFRKLRLILFNTFQENLTRSTHNLSMMSLATKQNVTKRNNLPWFCCTTFSRLVTNFFAELCNSMSSVNISLGSIRSCKASFKHASTDGCRLFKICTIKEHNACTGSGKIWAHQEA